MRQHLLHPVSHSASLSGATVQQVNTQPQGAAAAAHCGSPTSACTAVTGQLQGPDPRNSDSAAWMVEHEHFLFTKPPGGFSLLSADDNLRNTLKRNANSLPREHAVTHRHTLSRTVGTSTVPGGPTCFSILGPAFFAGSVRWRPDRRHPPGEPPFCVVQRVCGLTNGGPGVKLILLYLKIKKKKV